MYSKKGLGKGENPTTQDAKIKKHWDKTKERRDLRVQTQTHKLPHPISGI